MILLSELIERDSKEHRGSQPGGDLVKNVTAQSSLDNSSS